MTSNELKELVKQHFSLTEVQEEATNEIFGEIKDINGAFTLLFEGDVLEVGKEVKVRTTDGQELSAPDGFHELENGMMIKTEGGKVVEITEKTENETETEDEMAEEISEVEGVEVEKMEKTDDEKMEDADEEESMEEESVSPMVEEVAVAVIEAVKDEIESMKKDMEEMKRKMAEIEEAPATMKTEPEVKMSKDTKLTAEPFNKARFEMVMARALNK